MFSNRAPSNRSAGNRSAGVITILIGDLQLEAFTGDYYQHQKLPGGFAELNFQAFGENYIIILIIAGGFAELDDLQAFGEHATKLTEDLYFIDEPVIEFQGRIATHVIVKSPTAEYTSALPNIAKENMIERKVNIEVGNVTTCREVGERLLEKWGRNQRSITGNVPIVVTAKFKEKMRIWVPVANIDEYMILQRKVHDLATMKTTLTLGDIILSEEEHLARVLQEL